MGGSSSPTNSPSSAPQPQSPRHRRLQRGRSGLRKCLPHWPVIPLLYFFGLILCSFPVSLLLCPPPVPGSVYRSHQLFRLLRPHILADNSTPIELSEVWKYKKLVKPIYCPSSPTRETREGHGHNIGYLIVEANGGLNQQRSSICNAVAIAGLLNATLVIPQFHCHNVWRDPSEFGDIYDEDHFISTLAGFVNVVKELPLSPLERFDFNISRVPTVHVQAWAPINYYLEAVYPLLQNSGVIRIAPFANRLAMNVPPKVQVLRCLANYKSLRFAPPISILAKKLVKRMLRMSAAPDGKYLAMHLRFEEDMVAFSCCVYDGGVEERVLMNMVRENGWGAKFRHTSHLIDPALNRITGKCPLTPLEAGIMLRAMGFDNKTTIYLAAGKLYQAERQLAPFMEMFPFVYTKESLATPLEISPFKGYSSRLAALDYAVSLFSEVFVMTQGGNFPHFLTGHRKFIYGGHSKTIKPNKIKLVHLFHDTLASWEQIKLEMKQILFQSNQEGMMAPHIRKSRRKASVYQYPFPDCGCLLQNAQNITLSLANVEATLDDERLDFIM